MMKKLTYQDSIDHLRRWLKLKLVTVQGDSHIRETATKSSHELFLAVSEFLGGTASVEKIPIPGNDTKYHYRTSVTFPEEVIAKLNDYQQRSRPPKRQPLSYADGRQRQNIRLLGRTINWGKAYAIKAGLPNYWHALDEAMERLAKQEGIK